MTTLHVLTICCDSCATCARPMLQKLPANIFPFGFYQNQSAQMLRLGIEQRSNARKEDEYICEACKLAGRAKFTCVLCQQERASSDIEENFGCLPAEYLCKPCYQTVPAATWDATYERLREAHRYDFD